MKVIISVDTEADNQWYTSGQTTLNNLQEVPGFQNLCEEFKLKPTYLTSYEVVDSPWFKEYLTPLQKKGVAEIGAHLHPWSCPPFEEQSVPFQGYKPYPSEIDIQMFKSKLEHLTLAITERCGKSPTTYRAGRWGLLGSHLKVLEDNGYKTDTSVTPQISWEGSPGAGKGSRGPNYISAPLNPYFPDEENICISGGSKILEIPLSVFYVKRPHMSWLFLKRPNNLITRIARRLGFGPRPLRPLPNINTKQMCSMIQTASTLGLPLIHMMIHSSELLPEGSPYHKTKNDVLLMMDKIRGFFLAVEEAGLIGCTISEFTEDWISRSHEKTHKS